MPNRNLVYLFTGLVGLIILAILGFLYYNQNTAGTSSNNSANSANESTNTSTTSNFTSNTSPAELFSTKKNISCDVTIPEGKGKIYIGDKKFYGEFQGKTNGTDYVGFFIYDGQTAYVWGMGQKEGVKLELGPDGLSKSNPQSPTDLSKSSEVKCTSWTVDNSKFTPPSNITFKDFTSLLPK